MLNPLFCLTTPPALGGSILAKSVPIAPCSTLSWRCPYFLIPPCILTSPHWASDPTEHLIPLTTSYRAFDCIDHTSSYRTCYPTKRISLYHACHPSGHLTPPSPPHPTLTLPSLYSHHTVHVIPLGMLSHLARLMPPSASHPTQRTLSHKSHFISPSAPHPTKRTSFYRACHPAVYAIPPETCHFAEYPDQAGSISFHCSVFYPTVYPTLLLRS